MENYTHLILMKSRTQDAYATTFTVSYTSYRINGKCPQYQCFINEVSNTLNELFTESECNVEVQVVLPNLHRANTAKCTIDTQKIQSCPYLRSRKKHVLPRVEIVINYQQACLRIPSITAGKAIYNFKYDFQAHSICIYCEACAR